MTVGHNHGRRLPQLAHTGGVPWWGMVSIAALALGLIGCGLMLLLMFGGKDADDDQEPPRHIQ